MCEWCIQPEPTYPILDYTGPALAWDETQKTNDSKDEQVKLAPEDEDKYVSLEKTDTKLDMSGRQIRQKANKSS